MIMAYTAGPVSLIALRELKPDIKRPFKLPAYYLFCTVTMSVCTLITYWTGWSTYYKLLLTLLTALVIYLANTKSKNIKLSGSCNWLIIHYAGIAVVSYFGNFDGGKGIIPLGYDSLILIAWSTFTIVNSYRYRVSNKEHALLYKTELAD